MLLWLLLIIACGTIILLSVILVIVGIVKHNKNALIAAAVLFVIGCVGSAFSALAYTKKVVDYVRSDDFQNDARKGSQFVGETVGSVSSGVSDGVSATIDDEAIARLAKKSAAIMSKSVKTMASEFDSSFSKNIFLDSSLANSGFKFGRAEEKHVSGKNELQVFIEFTQNFNGKIRVTNYDQNGRKIDYSEKAVNAKAGEEKVEVFSFGHSDFGVTTYFIMESMP